MLFKFKAAQYIEIQETSDNLEDLVLETVIEIQMRILNINEFYTIPKLAIIYEFRNFRSVRILVMWCDLTGRNCLFLDS